MNKEVLETYTMTQEEEVKWLRQCVRELQEENIKLKELCDKYEEEHSTTFQIWKYNKDTYKEENERLNNIIDELEKYLSEEIEDYNKALNSKLLSESGKEKYEAEKVCFLDMLDKLNELGGKNE